MSLIRLNIQPSRRHLIQFGVAWVVFFLLLAILTVGKSAPEALWMLSLLAIVPPLIGCWFPGFLRLLYVALAVMTFPIGLVVSHGILAALYFLILTPTGLLLRLIKPGFFPKKPDSSILTYWHTRTASRTPSDYFKPY
jgi:hypothetical protein